MAEEQLSEVGKRMLEVGREQRAESMRQFAERTKGKPTPTQEENDEAAVGRSFVGMEHEADGSDPDPVEVNRHMESKPGGSYQTRHVAPSRAAAQPKPPTI